MAKKLRVIYYSWLCDDDLGEAQGFFEVVDNKLKLITGWSMNDANYRNEYMRGVFKYVGIDVQKLPTKYLKQATEQVKEMFGL